LAHSGQWLKIVLVWHELLLVLTGGIVPILSVNVPFKQAKNSALTNAAIPTRREVLVPANMRAVIPANNGTVAEHLA
jgi:hypothetical protein